MPAPAPEAKHSVAGWSSPVARQAHNLKVAGSNPAPATNTISPPFRRAFFVPALNAQPNRGRNAYFLVTEASQSERWWTVQRGPGPVVATAIHDGHDLRPEVRPR